MKVVYLTFRSAALCIRPESISEIECDFSIIDQFLFLSSSKINSLKPNNDIERQDSVESAKGRGGERE